MSVSAISSFSIDLERQLGPSPPPISRSPPPPATSPPPPPISKLAPGPRIRTTTPRPISGAELGDRRSRRMSHAAIERPQSRNFSRPSPPSSVSTPVEEWPTKRRRSSDVAPMRRAYSSQSLGTLSQMQMAVELPGCLPPFAPKADAHPSLHSPPPVAPSPTHSNRTSRRLHKAQSMDVMQAARRMEWEQKATTHVSTKSVVSDWSEALKSPSSTFAQRVFEAGKPDLMYDLRETKHFKERVHGVLDITMLERMNQHVLQQKLVEQVKAIGDKGAWMEIGIRQTLHEYCEAVRDMEFMEQCALRGRANDPFLITTTKPLEAKLLEDAGLALGNPKCAVMSMPGRLEYTKRPSATRQALHRLFMAIVGGLALLAPFVIINVISAQTVRLIITCACVVGFAAAVALGSELGPDKGALVTAAYAGALVVFVGTNPPALTYRP